MNKVNIFILAILVTALSFSCKVKQEQQKHWGKNWAWMAVEDLPDDTWNARFDIMKESGIDGLLILYNYSQDEEFRKVAKMSKEKGFEVHGWFVVMNPHNTRDTLYKIHPGWFVVSSDGVSCIDRPPYIPGYKWLCPSNKEVRNYVMTQVADFAKMEFLDGVHLDYIRLPDVILPKGLWSRYNLIQDQEYPEFDFCYCDICIKTFKDKNGYDPRELKDAPQDSLWRQFRYDIITNIVDGCYGEVKKYNKKLSAAVFPGPSLAKMMVRQDWANWKIDELMPMMYHQYYNEPISWIETVTREGVDNLKEGVSLFSGLFIGEIPPEKMKEAVECSKNGGAKGICLFIAGRMSQEQWNALGNALKEEAD